MLQRESTFYSKSRERTFPKHLLVSTGPREIPFPGSDCNGDGKWPITEETATLTHRDTATAPAPLFGADNLSYFQFSLKSISSL